MQDAGELWALGILTAHANMMIRDAGALHPTQTGYGPSLPSVAQKTLKPFPTWTERLVGTHICCYHELLRWLTVLLCFVEAQSDILEPLLRSFCKSPGMCNSDYQAICDQVPEWHQRQLAAAILSNPLFYTP